MDIGNIGMMLLVIIGGCTGLLTTVVITLGIPIVVIWKIIRRITKGIPITR